MVMNEIESTFILMNTAVSEKLRNMGHMYMICDSTRMRLRKQYASTEETQTLQKAIKLNCTSLTAIQEETLKDCKKMLGAYVT